MSVPTVDEANAVQQTGPPPMARLPLRAELYLLAHDDDTGELHINEQSLAVGLAGAILLELWLAQRVAIGWVIDPARQQWQPRPGRITIINTEPIGDPLSDAALAAIRHTENLPHGLDQLRVWLRRFAATDLYERVRANMVTVGVLHRATRRRYAGLVKTDTHVPVHYGYPVRARAYIRDAVQDYAEPRRYHREPPDEQCVALCGLVDVLELAPLLYLDMSTGQLRELLRHLVGRHNSTIGTVVAAVDAGRGDLAVAAMR